MQEPDISKIPIQIDEEWNMNGNLRSFETPYVYYPAIAIPLNQKTEFVCPPEHIASLEAALETAKHVVTVGWRGSEDRFCRLLQTHCPKNKIRLHVVSTSEKSATSIADNLNATYIHNAHVRIYKNGFSGFMRDHDSSDLLKILS